MKVVGLQVVLVERCRVSSKVLDTCRSYCVAKPLIVIVVVGSDPTTFRDATAPEL